jgi:hypothetical protein
MEQPWLTLEHEVHMLLVKVHDVYNGCSHIAPAEVNADKAAGAVIH